MKKLSVDRPKEFMIYEIHSRKTKFLFENLTHNIQLKFIYKSKMAVNTEILVKISLTEEFSLANRIHFDSGKTRLGLELNDGAFQIKAYYLG